MKTVSIGDTHGAAVADTVLKLLDNHDKFIFAGDYVDSFSLDNTSVRNNLLDVIELKASHPDKIILLWGNHDIQYLLGERFYCSGHRQEMQDDLNSIFSKNEHFFQFAFQVNDVLWTHAGINEVWYRQRFRFQPPVKSDVPVAELLNQSFAERYEPLFDVGYVRGGIFETGGPLWCDKSELRSVPMKGLHQITGHNRVKNFEEFKSDDKEITLIDILGFHPEVDESLFYYRVI